MKTKIFKFYLWLVFAGMVIFTSCDSDKNPVTPHEEHNEAEGLVLKINNQAIVIVKEGKVQSGKITVKVNTTTEAILAKFYSPDGDEFTPTEAGSSLGLEISDPLTAAKVLFADRPWEFAIQGKKVGTTNLLIKLIHGDHPDFTAPAIPIEVIN